MAAANMKISAIGAALAATLLAAANGAAAQSARGERAPRVDRAPGLRDDGVPPQVAAVPTPELPSTRKTVRAGKTFGPDLLQPAFAPVEAIIVPMNGGLSIVDAGMAPVTAALAPLIGPIPLSGSGPVVSPK